MAASTGGLTTTAAYWVRSARSRLVSASICSSSPWASAKKVRTCLESAVASDAPLRRSTKKRYPLSVGTRPALVWGWCR